MTREETGAARAGPTKRGAPQVPGGLGNVGRRWGVRPIALGKRARQGTAKGLKSFVGAEYGLRLDRRSVGRLARDTAQAGRIPQEIMNLGREIEAWATGFVLS